MDWTRTTVQLQIRLTKAAVWTAIDIGPLPSIGHHFGGITVGKRRESWDDGVWRHGNVGRGAEEIRNPTRALDQKAMWGAEPSPMNARVRGN